MFPLSPLFSGHCVGAFVGAFYFRNGRSTDGTKQQVKWRSLFIIEWLNVSWRLYVCPITFRVEVINLRYLQFSVRAIQLCKFYDGTIVGW